MRSDDNNEPEGHRYADTMISMSMKDGISGADLTIRLICALRAVPPDRYLGGESAQRVDDLTGPRVVGLRAHLSSNCRTVDYWRTARDQEYLSDWEETSARF